MKFLGLNRGSPHLACSEHPGLAFLGDKRSENRQPLGTQAGELTAGGERSPKRGLRLWETPKPSLLPSDRAWNQREHTKVAVKSADDKDVPSVFQNTRLIKKAPSPTEKVSDRRN